MTSIVRWTARAWSIVTILFVMGFLIGEGFSPEHFQLVEWLGFLFFPFGICLGLIVAWWKEGLGAIIIISSLFAFYLIHFVTTGTFPKGWAWAVFAAPGFLFALCWYRSCKVVSPAP